MKRPGQKVLHDRASAQEAGRLGRSAIVLGVAALSIGAISYAFIFVGSRRLADDSMAELLTLWAIMNTTVLSVLIPLDTLAPRLLHGQRQPSLIGDGSRVFLVHGGVLGLVGGLVSIVIFSISGGGGVVAYLVAGLAYCLILGLWSGTRARLIGVGEFPNVLVLSLVTTSVALLGIALLYVVGFTSGVVLIGCVAGAYLAGLAVWRMMTRSAAPARAERGSDIQLSLGMENYKMLATLVAVTFATLVLNNGGLVLARALDMDSRRIVVYAAALSIVRIPIMLANNLTPPVNLRIAELAADDAWHAVRRLSGYTLGAFAGIVSLGLLATAVLGPVFVQILIGGDSGVDSAIVVLALLGEGLIWLTVIPRILLVALGMQRAMMIAWAVGLASFVIWISLPIAAEWKVIGGPIVGGMTTLLVGLSLAFWALRERIDRTSRRDLTSA